MTGWLIFVALALLTWLALYLSRRCSRLTLELIAAALLAAAAGYAWQGSPDMAGQPASIAKATQ